ncbi:hypothetical protein JCM11251_004298 [Rhodosporidiobolus azoricus]
MAPARRSSTASKSSPTKSSPKKEEKKTPSKKQNPHPPFAEMITVRPPSLPVFFYQEAGADYLEAIESEGDKRGEASRPAIKKYILKAYDLEDTPAFSSYVNAAINRGADNGAFALPKGQSGKIKIAHGKEPAAQKARTPGTRKVPSRAATSKTAENKPAAPKKTIATSGGSGSSGRSSSTSKSAKERMSEGGKKGAAKTNAKETKAPAKRTTAASRRAAGEKVKPTAPAKKTVGRKSIGAKKESGKPATNQVVARKPPAKRNRA